MKSSKCSPEPKDMHVFASACLGCVCVHMCVHVCVCAVGGLFLSLQCSLPAGGDDDRSPVLCSEPGGWQDQRELINTDAPQTRLALALTVTELASNRLWQGAVSTHLLPSHPHTHKPGVSAHTHYTLTNTLSVHAVSKKLAPIFFKKGNSLVSKPVCFHTYRISACPKRFEVDTSKTPPKDMTLTARNRRVQVQPRGLDRDPNVRSCSGWRRC